MPLRVSFRGELEKGRAPVIGIRKAKRVPTLNEPAHRIRRRRQWHAELSSYLRQSNRPAYSDQAEECVVVRTNVVGAKLALDKLTETLACRDNEKEKRELLRRRRVSAHPAIVPCRPACCAGAERESAFMTSGGEALCETLRVNVLPPFLRP